MAPARVDPPWSEQRAVAVRLDELAPELGPVYRAAKPFPHIVIDGQSHDMKPSPMGEGLYDFEYQVPAGFANIPADGVVTARLADRARLSIAARPRNVAGVKDSTWHRP